MGLEPRRPPAGPDGRLDELRDVSTPLAERRDTHLDDVESIIEILSERLFLERILNLDICGCEDSYIDRPFDVFTDP
jgi:hypothetical protein